MKSKTYLWGWHVQMTLYSFQNDNGIIDEIELKHIEVMLSAN